MTLKELKAFRGAMFMEQDWYDDESFMERQASPPLYVPTGTSTEPGDTVVGAVDLAVLFLSHPNDPIWKRFLWTSDYDDLGQRIYVGGIGQAKKPGFQIHRHLEITDLWGWPVFT